MKHHLDHRIHHWKPLQVKTTHPRLQAGDYLFHISQKTSVLVVVFITLFSPLLERWLYKDSKRSKPIPAQSTRHYRPKPETHRDQALLLMEMYVMPVLNAYPVRETVESPTFVNSINSNSSPSTVPPPEDDNVSLK